MQERLHYVVGLVTVCNKVVWLTKVELFIRKHLDMEINQSVGLAANTVRRAPKTSISRDNRNESLLGGRTQVMGPQIVMVGGSMTESATW